MDQRPNPDDPTAAEDISLQENGDDLPLEPPPAPPPLQRDTHSEPKYALPPLPPLTPAPVAAANEQVAQTPPSALSSGQGHRPADKILTPRQPVPEPHVAPPIAYPYPSASPALEGQTSPQMAAPMPLPLSAPITQPIQPQAESYPPQQQPGYPQQSYYPSRKKFPAWAWGALGSIVTFAIVLIALFALVRPPGIAGRWKPDLSQPTAIAKGIFDLSSLDRIMNKRKCGYADAIEFLQDGTTSLTNTLGTDVDRYEIIEGNHLKITSPSGNSLWTFSVAGDSLTLQGPEGCVPARYVRVK